MAYEETRGECEKWGFVNIFMQFAFISYISNTYVYVPKVDGTKLLKNKTHDKMLQFKIKKIKLNSRVLQQLAIRYFDSNSKF